MCQRLSKHFAHLTVHGFVSRIPLLFLSVGKISTFFFSKVKLVLFLTGGTFALYSLLCRHAKINTIPNQHRTDEELTTYSRQTYEENSVAAKIKRWLEAHAYKRNSLLILVLIGTCTAIGDGILTPAISGTRHHLRFPFRHHSLVHNSDNFWIMVNNFVFLYSSFCVGWNKSSESEHEYR
jgi:hypothetical protein